MVTHEDAAKEKQAEIQGLVSLTESYVYAVETVRVDDPHKMVSTTSRVQTLREAIDDYNERIRHFLDSEYEVDLRVKKYTYVDNRFEKETCIESTIIKGRFWGEEE